MLMFDAEDGILCSDGHDGCGGGDGGVEMRLRDSCLTKPTGLQLLIIETTNSSI